MGGQIAAQRGIPNRRRLIEVVSLQSLIAWFTRNVSRVYPQQTLKDRFYAPCWVNRNQHATRLVFRLDKPTGEIFQSPSYLT